MLYLLGVNLPDEKVVSIALSKIYGIGKKTGQDICKKLNIPDKLKLKDLSEDKLNELTHELNGMVIESDLKRQIAANIKHLSDINCYRGIRHRAGLPVRGQRTRNNIKTAKSLNGKTLRASGIPRQYST